MCSIRMFFLFLVVLTFTSLTFAQPMSYSLNNVPGEYGGTMLTTTCGGSDPIPDGEGIVYIYQDLDGNGPSTNDPLISVCDHPENECVGGPIGSFNFNSFPINGQETLSQAGYFVGLTYLISYANMPPLPYRFYVRVKYPNNNCPQVTWVSDVKTASLAGVGDWYFTNWDCQINSLPPCEPSPDVHFGPGPFSPSNHPVCVQLCQSHVTNIFVGPGASQSCSPVLWIVPGCFDGTCYSIDPYIYDPNGWTWTSIDGENYYVNTITLNPSTQPCYQAASCVTISFDICLPVEMGTVSFTPLSNKVHVTWNTLSESNLDRFEIRRDGNRIGSRNATNNATGAEYEFTDESVENGRTYRYELVVVNLDNSTETVAQESVTPQMGIGVVSEFALYQNYPNPFNPTTSISFDLVDAENVSLKVFNLMGQPVAELVKGTLTAGHHDIAFDAKTLPSGVYVYQLTTGSFHAQKKMLLMK